MIPTHFSICGINYEVRIVPAGDWHQYNPSGDADGMLITEKCLILIRGGLVRERTQQTWLHEVMHLLYDTIGHDLNSNEAHVDLMASLLHQVLTTMRTEAEPRNTAKRKRAK